MRYLFSFILTVSSICAFAQSDIDWRLNFSTVVQHLKEMGDVEDLSCDTVLSIPEPSFAYVNIKGAVSLPSSKITPRNVWIEMYDGAGHYFKKRVVMTAQGNYTLRLEKKSYNFDFSEDDWSVNRQPDITFGDWVSQDGFHLKGFYTDALRGVSEVGYHLFEDVVEDRAPFWERCGYNKDSNARCFSDGFPCAVYFNGDYLGLYVWQLKKSRKNMNMKKHTAEHIHLDGDLRDVFFFNGKIEWEHFDVRNPHDLYSTTDVLYDGNTPVELMGAGSPYIETSESAEHLKDISRTIKVKNYIIDFSQFNNYFNELEAQEASVSTFKREFEKRYDIQSLLDYYVFHRMVMNLDGQLKNWQWFTYNGKKWMVAPYDLDMTFGVTLYGFPVPVERSKSFIDNGPYPWINKYYVEEERQRYIQLRDNNVFSVENINSKLQNWHDRIGEEYYSLEQLRWSDSPCYNDMVCNPNWELYEGWEEFDQVRDYNPVYTYHEGDICLFQARLWRATGPTCGVEPPLVNAGKDNIDRITEWVKKRIDYMDAFYGYVPVSVGIDDTLDDKDGLSHGDVTGIYDVSGKAVNTMSTGVYFYKYSDGYTRKIVKRAN